ncbi:hypothetical protein JW756_05025 [Candidatus Woesearchaeota archaeon]|nr:hypothetical protein [Candidatus Woesearchaeota archaeon]
MGFLDFLKAKSSETIGFTEIDSWLDKQVADKHLEQKVARAKGFVLNKIIEAHKLLNELEKAGLMNENIPIKAKQIMDGHRKAYIQRLKRFLDEIEMPEDFSQIGFFAAKFSEDLTKLSAETQKNYLVLKEFMEAEIIKVAKTIKAIEEELSRLQAEIENEGIEAIKDAKLKLRQYHDDLKKKAMLEEEKLNQGNEVDSLRERKVKMQTRLDDLHQTNEYNEFKDLLENKKKYEEQLKAIETELKVIFAHLNRPLRKYKHASLQEKLIDKYLLDPMGALEEDASFTLIEVLDRMKQELGNLELKENQLEKTVEMIDKLNKDFIMNKKLDIDKLKELNKETASRINTSVIALNIAETDTLLRGLSEKIIQAEQSLEEISKALEGINLDYLKQKVKEKINEINPKVTIKD